MCGLLLNFLRLAVMLTIIPMVLLFVPLVHIDRSTAARIQAGMPLDEVEAIIGGPPAEYDGMTDSGNAIKSDSEQSEFVETWVGSTGKVYVHRKWGLPAWTGGSGVIVVDLDASHRVRAAGFVEIEVSKRHWARFLRERVSRHRFKPVEHRFKPDERSMHDLIPRIVLGWTIGAPLALAVVMWRRRNLSYRWSLAVVSALIVLSYFWYLAVHLDGYRMMNDWIAFAMIFAFLGMSVLYSCLYRRPDPIGFDMPSPFAALPSWIVDLEHVEAAADTNEVVVEPCHRWYDMTNAPRVSM